MPLYLSAPYQYIQGLNGECFFVFKFINALGKFLLHCYSMARQGV